ncbi:hypothetical protein [Roseixanthobacter pseudopolyaromaticivorans]|uniref:hypothetical protein n=1 Tax=Xanthobacteraceae TaxID=335928 RepID=UPI00372B4E8E
MHFLKFFRLVAATRALDVMASSSDFQFSPAQAPPTASSAAFNFTYDATNRRLTQSANDSS